jgi:hypothetical protein
MRELGGTLSKKKKRVKGGKRKEISSEEKTYRRGPACELSWESRVE